VDPALKPDQSQVVRSQGLGPFVTFLEYRRPDGLVQKWESRRQRKSRSGSTWWAPRSRSWWIGILFAIGSILFALGSVPGYAQAVGRLADSITFFIGSLFFTSAAFLQYSESEDVSGGSSTGRWGRLISLRPRQIDWWASAIQLIGTVYFNVSTAVAISTDLSAQTARQHVWRPDAVGSVCFLVASGLAWAEVSHGWASWAPRKASWWITLLNLVGSIAFGVSAVASYVVPATGQIRDLQRSNVGTFIGALCFLVGSVLLLPEGEEQAADQAGDQPAASG
jgi:hypothetical protein